MNMNRQLIHTNKAPAAVGPYSQAVKYGGLLYTAGQIPIDPATNQLVLDSFAVQVRQVLNNLRAVCEAAGTSLDQAIKVTVYLQDLSKFAELNAIYEEYFGQSKPARSTVQAAALPKGVDVEMDLIAVCPD